MSDLHQLHGLLPREAPARGMESGGASSFSGGMFVHGGVLGLRRNTRAFPKSCSVVAAFASTYFPSHEYTSFVFMHNVCTALHRDSHNCRSSLNLVVGLSKFEGGAIWVADDGGDVTEEIDGKPLKGRDLEVQRGPVAFQPRRWHFTRAWSGDRTVLVLYSVRDCIKACSGDLRFLAGLGFHLPANVYIKFRSLRPFAPVDTQGQSDASVAWQEHKLEQPTPDDDELYDGEVCDLPNEVTRDLAGFDADQFVLPKKCKRRLRELLRRPGFLDCYSGSRGVAHELAEVSGTWVLTFDYGHSADRRGPVTDGAPGPDPQSGSTPGLLGMWGWTCLLLFFQSCSPSSA